MPEPRATWPEPPPWPEVPPPWRPGRPYPWPPPVPVVPSGPPEGSEGQDVFDRLFERRIVLVTGYLGNEVATRAAAQLMLLDASGDGPIDLHLSCADGDLDAATALADTIDLVGVSVRAWCGGTVGGPALAPLVAAERRLAHRHAQFVLKDPTVRLEGRAEELVTLVAAHQRQLDGLHERLAAATGQPVARIAADMGAGLVLAAEEAVAYGLVHEVVRSA